VTWWAWLLAGVFGGVGGMVGAYLGLRYYQNHHDDDL
jgi:hypothetical protein